MTDNKVKTPKKRKSFLSPQVKNESIKKPKFNESGPNDMGNIGPKTSNKKNPKAKNQLQRFEGTKMNLLQVNKKERQISNNAGTRSPQSKKKRKIESGEKDADALEKKPKVLQKESPLEGKKKRKGTFFHIAALLESGNKKDALKNIETKISAFESKTDLSKTAKRKLRILKRLREEANEGQLKTTTEKRRERRKDLKKTIMGQLKGKNLQSDKQEPSKEEESDVDDSEDEVDESEEESDDQMEDASIPKNIEESDDESNEEVNEEEGEESDESEEGDDESEEEESGEEVNQDSVQSAEAANDEEDDSDVSAESDEVEKAIEEESAGSENESDEQSSEEESDKEIVMQTKKNIKASNAAVGSKNKQNKSQSEGKSNVKLVDLKQENLIKSDQKRYVVFVGNIAYDTTKNELIEHFNKAGQIKHIRIPTEKKSNKPRGFAYVEVENEETYQKCLSLHHSILKNRRINVQYTQGGKKKGDNQKKEIKAKNFKLHAMRKEGMLTGSQKQSQKRSVRRAKQRKASTSKDES